MHAQRQLDAGETPAFFAATEMQAEEVNIIGTLYKLFFRRLPVPLIPFDCYDALIAAQASHDNEKIMQAAEARFLIICAQVHACGCCLAFFADPAYSVPGARFFWSRRRSLPCPVSIATHCYT